MEKISYVVKDFEGPLDLLLHLISKNKLDINNIKVSEILDQYMEHISKMKELDMEVSSEFLEMAARLIYIKTVSLLPKHEEIEELKKELSGQLIEYQECKRIAQIMSEIIDLDSFVRSPEEVDLDMTYTNKHTVHELFKVYSEIKKIKKTKNVLPTQESFSGIVSRKIVSVTSKIVYVLKKLLKNERVEYLSLFESSSSKSDMVALFLAVLELTRSKRIRIDDTKNQMSLQLVRK